MKVEGYETEEVYNFLSFSNVSLSSSVFCFAWLLFGLLLALRGLCHTHWGLKTLSCGICQRQLQLQRQSGSFIVISPKCVQERRSYIGHKICRMKNVSMLDPGRWIP